jgi:hypothetical protein
VGGAIQRGFVGLRVYVGGAGGIERVASDTACAVVQRCRDCVLGGFRSSIESSVV